MIFPHSLDTASVTTQIEAVPGPVIGWTVQHQELAAAVPVQHQRNMCIRNMCIVKLLWCYVYSV